jgi:chromosome segregation ATPase
MRYFAPVLLVALVAGCSAPSPGQTETAPPCQCEELESRLAEEREGYIKAFAALTDEIVEIRENEKAFSHNYDRHEETLASLLRLTDIQTTFNNTISVHNEKINTLTKESRATSEGLQHAAKFAEATNDRLDSLERRTRGMVGNSHVK